MSERARLETWRSDEDNSPIQHSRSKCLCRLPRRIASDRSCSPMMPQFAELTSCPTRQASYQGFRTAETAGLRAPTATTPHFDGSHDIPSSRSDGEDAIWQRRRPCCERPPKDTTNLYLNTPYKNSQTTKQGFRADFLLPSSHFWQRFHRT